MIGYVTSNRPYSSMPCGSRQYDLPPYNCPMNCCAELNNGLPLLPGSVTPLYHWISVWLPLYPWNLPKLMRLYEPSG